MDNQIHEDPYRILARERSHEDARQTVATNRMLVQSLVIVNGGGPDIQIGCARILNRFWADGLQYPAMREFECLGTGVVSRCEPLIKTCF
jgi:hypothetical protein